MVASNPESEGSRSTTDESFSVRVYKLVGLILVSSLLVAIVELRAYSKNILNLERLDISSWDSCLVFWSLWAKTLVVLLPLLAVSVLLLWRGRFRLGKNLVLLGTLLVVSWLIMDVRLQRITGGHVSDYLTHLTNPKAWQWSGNLTSITRRIGSDLSLVVAGLVLLCAVMNSLTHHMMTKFPKFSERWLVCAGSVGLIGVVVGIFPAIQFVDQPLILEQLYSRMTTNALIFQPEMVPGNGTAAFGKNIDAEFRSVGEWAQRAISDVLPIDKNYQIKKADPPNVIVIITESFRHNILEPETMPKMAAWAKEGLVCREHYACSNKSNLGTFSLLYGRWPIAYYSSLDAELSPQMPYTFRKSGYESSLITSCTFASRMYRMNEFMNEDSFENCVVYNSGNHLDAKGEKLPPSIRNWAQNDRLTLNRIRKVITENSGEQPQFITTYLMSTHYSYACPPEYEKLWTTAPSEARQNSDRSESSIKQADLLNRYQNSAAFLDDELYKLVSSLDPEKNIVVLTGDHGESIYEDGFATHGSTLSKFQTCVPMVIVGAGVAPQVIDSPTSHVDILPTLLHLIEGQPTPIANLHGKDLLETRTEQTLVAQCYSDSWDLMLIHPEGRLKLNLQNHSPNLRVLGFCDEQDRISNQLGHPSTEIRLWKQRWIKELSPMNRIRNRLVTRKTSSYQ